MDRQTLIRTIHAAAKVAGLDDENYRDRLERLTGKRSCVDLTDDQLRAALRDFRKAGTHLHPHAQKAKALWIGLSNLGAVDGSDAALDAFAQRQTGAAKLAFVGAIDARKLTEALKAMAAREAWDIPSDDTGGMAARINLVAAQWRKLNTLGVVRTAAEAALMHWAHNQQIVRGFSSPRQWKRHELDLAAKKLGQWIRNAQKKAKSDAGFVARTPGSPSLGASRLAGDDRQ